MRQKCEYFFNETSKSQNIVFLIESIEMFIKSYHIFRNPIIAFFNGQDNGRHTQLYVNLFV